MADRYPLIYNPTANQIQELQSGDSIDLGGGNIKNAVFSGIITATGFSGDGSALTNVSVTETSTLDNVLARGNTSSRSVTFGPITGTTGTFSGDVTVANLTAANVTIAGTITYDDVTHVDSQGIGTFRQGIDVVGHSEVDTLRVSGITTFQSNVHLADNVKINLGTSDDLEIYHDSTNSIIENNKGELQLITTNPGTSIILQSASDVLLKVQNGESAINAYSNGGVELFHDNLKKLETTGYGVTVTGIMSATQYYGDGSKLTGVAAAGGGALDITSCLFI